jgi:hypothetical protein
MALDPARLPRAAEYVSALPQELESFGQCGARSVLFEPLVRDFSRLATETSLPQQVSDLLSGRLSRQRRVPEVVFQTASLTIRDLAFADDAAFYRWIFTTSQETFDAPLVRNLMKLVSPSLTVLGATKRWSAFHEGTDAIPGATEVVNGRSETRVELRYPEGVFSRTFLGGLTQAFLAAIMAARAKEPRVELETVESGRSLYLASWAR